jgi:hypothetical protein
MTTDDRLAAEVSFADSGRRASGEDDSAFWAEHFRRTDSAQFRRWYLVSALRAGRGERRQNFFQINLFPGGHSGDLIAEAPVNLGQ